MCMCNRVSVEIAQVEAFKIFAHDEEGRLVSCFMPSYKRGQFYEINKKIRVDKEDAGFYAFQKFEDALDLAYVGRQKWNMVNNKLLVLPVTLSCVFSKGSYRDKSDDPQCLDGYYPVYEAKEIIVRHTQHYENEFYDAVIKRAVKEKLILGTDVLKKAFDVRLPQYVS